MTQCPQCSKQLPGPACLRMHIAAAHSAEAMEKGRKATHDGGVR